MPTKPIHAYRTLFKLQGYLDVFGFRVSTSISSWIDFTLIFIVLIGQFDATAMQLAMASTLMWLPILVFGPAAGALADRYPAQRILLAALMVRAASVMLLFIAPTVEVLLLAVPLRALGNLGSSPLPLAVRHIVPKALLPDSVRLGISVEQGTRLVAPLVAVGAAFLPTPQQGFAVSAVLTLMTFFLPARLGRVMANFPSPQSASAEPSRPALTPWMLLKRSPQLSLTLGTSVLYCFTIGFLEPLIPLMLTAIPEGARSYGFVMGMTSAGALVGAHFATRLSARLGSSELMRWCLAATACATASTAGIVLSDVAMTGWGIAIYWMLTGACYAMMLTCLGLAVQTHAPTARIGAISAKIQNIRLMALVAGPMVGGAVVKYLGVGVGLLGAAVFAGVSCVVLQRWGAHLAARIPIDTAQQP